MDSLAKRRFAQRHRCDLAENHMTDFGELRTYSEPGLVLLGEGPAALHRLELGRQGDLRVRAVHRFEVLATRGRRRDAWRDVGEFADELPPVAVKYAARQMPDFGHGFGLLMEVGGD